MKKTNITKHLHHQCDFYAFIIFSRLPICLRHFISSITYHPIFHKGAIVFGYTVFGPNVEIGEYTYLHSPLQLSNIKIGKFCSIAKNFNPLSHQHKFDNFFNYKFNNEINSPFTASHFKSTQHVNKVEKIIIGNDVYIGFGVTILKGVTVGNGSIIGAGSIVTKDIPPFTIYAGTPAKFIKNKLIKDKQIKNFDFDDPQYMSKLDQILTTYDRK